MDNGPQRKANTSNAGLHLAWFGWELIKWRQIIIRYCISSNDKLLIETESCHGLRPSYRVNLIAASLLFKKYIILAQFVYLMNWQKKQCFADIG
jgi:hypothetical protein